MRETVGKPQSYGAIGGGRLTNEEAFVLQHLFRVLGTKNLDWRAGRQRQATPGARAGALTEIERAQLVVVAGDSPGELAPVFDLRIRKAELRNGARIVKANDPSALPDLAGVERAALVWDGVDLTLGRRLEDRLSTVPQLRTYILGEQPNARGAEAMGMLPEDGGRDSLELFSDAREGKLAALSLFGVNPVRNAPSSAGAKDALAGVPFVAVTELFMTETAELATLVLPAKGAFEKSGTTTNFAGDVLALERSLVAPDGPLSDLEMLVGLAIALGVELPTIEEVGSAVAERSKRAASHSFGDRRYGASGDGEASPWRLLSGSGTYAHDERIAALREAIS